MELKTKEAKENRRTSQANKAGSLEQGEQAAFVEPQPQPAPASSPDLASIETLVRSPHLDHEGWLRWTYDTGAAARFHLDDLVRSMDGSSATAAAEPVHWAFRPKCLHKDVPLFGSTSQRPFFQWWSPVHCATAERRTTPLQYTETWPRSKPADAGTQIGQSNVTRRKLEPCSASPCSIPRR